MAGNEPRPTSTTSERPSNPRQFYLAETLGLSHDPFDGPVAEQELHSTEKEPYFFAYYTDPTPVKFDKPLLQTLRERRSGLIFGPPGSGKTTLRYTLEAECRAVFDRTLVVTYELSHKISRPPTAEEHWTNLARELAIDLFIQVVEQLNIIDAPTKVQLAHLHGQMALVWPRLRRTVELLLTDDFSTRDNGLAALWPRLNRPAIRYVSPSARIRQFIEASLPQEADSPVTSTGQTLLQAGLAAAKAWGFERVFVLVDGVDALEREVDSMLALIAPLLDNLAHWQTEQLYFFSFLPLELENPLNKTYREKFNLLPFSPIWYIIEWHESNLTELLHQRLRAAGSRLPGFNALAATDLGPKLEQALIDAAKDSPRRLLQVVSALIDAHAQSKPERVLITAQDWQQMRQQWSYGLPLPPDLPANGYSP